MAVCAAMVVLEPVIFNFITLFLRGYFLLVGHHTIGGLGFVWWNGWILFSFIPYLFGAARVRRRLQAATAA